MTTQIELDDSVKQLRASLDVLLERYDTLEVENATLRAALERIYDCMGGDEHDGWSAPEDVWSIAREALASLGKPEGRSTTTPSR